MTITITYSVIHPLSRKSLCHMFLNVSVVQSGAAYQSQGFEDKNFGSSPCLLGQ